MNTPIYDFLKKYAVSDTLRCHMPGHKGRSADALLPFALDITEISGADSLFDAAGIIAESEKNMARLYGSAAAAYSAGGSTLCIQAMLAIMKQENRTVFAVRNVHRAFLNASALLGIDVQWILPEYSGGILSGTIDPDMIEQALGGCGGSSCLYVTSPDYTGKLADIKTLAKICRRHNARLLVDNAHGAHLAFFGENIHPIALGADMCCDSAHKMLPALTGAAVLHTAHSEYTDKLKQAMSFFGSTSPSYPIMASLDLCCRYIAENIHRDIAENLDLLAGLRERLSDAFVFTDGDPFHLTINTRSSCRDGNEIADILRRSGIECEYSDSGLVILLMSPVCREADYKRLESALLTAAEQSVKCTGKAMPFPTALPEKVISIREAVFAPSEEIDVEKAEGRICAAVRVPCPPAIPIAASGERISRECVNIFKSYGISTVNVVK